MVDVSLTIEMMLIGPLADESGNILIDESENILVGDSWVDVSLDVVARSPVTWTRGNRGSKVSDRVADIGSLMFELNNSWANSDGTAGLYSPDHASVAKNFGLDTLVRIRLTEGATTHEEWMGEISSISPDSWVYGKQGTKIVCEDWMAHAARDKIRGVTVQVGKRDDQILTTVLALASKQPQTKSFSTGDDTYSYALHDENSLKTSLMKIFQKLAMSGFGRIYLTNYSTLVYKSRSDLLLSGTPAGTLNNTMNDMRVTRRKSQRVKEIFVTTYPVELDSSPVVLWVAQRERSLTAGEGAEFDVSFRDPSGRAKRVAAVSLETPAANTDYKFSSTPGSGNDLNANLSISNALKADIATVSLENTGGSTGYLWLHQVRGTGVYLYEPETIYSETGQQDGETLNVDMVYQDDPLVGADISSLLTSWFAVDQSDIEPVKFIANTNQTLMDNAFLVPGELVSISETQTGFDDNMIINGTSKVYNKGILTVIWYLVPANQISGVWQLEVAGSSELDSTTILAA